jgi:nucleoside phosphorylase
LAHGRCGGGAPTENADIRLGDVAVSVPTGRHNGVVQHDYGKTIANGEFEYTSILNTPPSLLLRAISRLQADDTKNTGLRISELVDNMLQRRPEMMDDYSHRGQERDVLFESDYEHPQGQNTCDICDLRRRRKRPSRESLNPVVYYGTIASGNQVIKHAQTRDRLARELGILCFEMEAAGLMDNFPCLAIRGICDYSDSRKNKSWQRYAAATAAAYAKRLLSVVPVNVNSQSSISASHTEEQFIANDADPSHTQVEKRQELLESLSFKQINTRHMTIRTAHLNTCKWLLNHEQYKEWLDPDKIDEHHGFLWIKGKPAAGKSTIMKYIFTRSKKSSTGSITISYFFNARGEELEKSVLGLYRSLLYQLFIEVPHLQNALDSIHLVSHDPLDAETWSIETLSNVFQSAIEQLGQRSLMCFIDALDECEENAIRDMLRFFE